MKINILISTFNDGILRVADLLLPWRDDVIYTVSFQYTGEIWLTQIPEALRRPDVEVFPLEGRGLSLNRNHCIAHATGDIALIADDDVRYTPDYLDRVSDTFKRHPDVDVALFKIKTYPGEPEYKNYADREFEMKRVFQHHHPASVEIAFRLDKIGSRIRFDERFGLGSPYLMGGEELVFIDSCLRHHLRVRYFPEYVVIHPYISSNKKELYSHKGAMTMGAITYYFRRKRVWISLIAHIFRSIRDILNNDVSLSSYYKSYCKGVFYIKRERVK